MNVNAKTAVENGDNRSVGPYLGVGSDALFGVILNHCDQVATTTTRDGFSMVFTRGGMSLCRSRLEGQVQDIIRERGDSQNFGTPCSGSPISVVAPSVRRVR